LDGFSRRAAAFDGFDVRVFTPLADYDFGDLSRHRIAGQPARFGLIDINFIEWRELFEHLPKRRHQFAVYRRSQAAAAFARPGLDGGLSLAAP
jgi:hypothetical protein